MPELPEVETMVRGIRPSVEGRKLVSLLACPCVYRPIAMKPALRYLSRRATGEIIVAVRRRAKRVVLELSSGEGFVIEPRMTGLMLLADPPDREHLRLEWRLSNGKGETSLWFWDRRGLGTVSLLSQEELQALLAPGRLGRDALEMTVADWRALCAGTLRPIKVALLDQQRVAGIGNLYASEILHLCRVHPELPARELSKKQIERLASATLEILKLAIRYEGSTLSDGTYRNALNQSGGYQNAHRVYDRSGETCCTCSRETIVRIVQAQRSTFFCPRCQR